MKARIWIYRISTALLSLLMLYSAGMYFAKHDIISGIFESLGYPTHIIYPLAVAKILGIVALWAFNRKPIQEWAYAGFFFDFILAFAAHVAAQDGEFGGAFFVMALLFASYFCRPAS